MKLPAIKPGKKQKATTASGSQAFPIVAIGASAGGLEAITELLSNLSPTTGMAFIYVQHLSPDHKSMLTSILAKVTAMKVQEVEDKVLIEPDNVYIIPPDKEMTVTDNHMLLTPRPENPKINLPIDIFFTSLAKSHKDQVIGIILSGSASDGTEGMKSIKEEGGLTFAQNESAKFSSMPKSAIAAGIVDFILSPKEIALELNKLSKHPLITKSGRRSAGEDLIENNNPDLIIILDLLRKSTGVDFSSYKMKTVKRRILRRMLLNKLNTIKQYANLLGKNKEEVDILYQDILINVTSFFRDSDSYKYLKSVFLPKLLKEKNPGEMLRIWVPACSTGEEAFSIAMMLIELQDKKSEQIPVQIFATDLSEKAIQNARMGVYSKSDLEEVSPQRIHRFFTKSERGYHITKSVRKMCVFAPHNILYDPPFSRIDFISCRNLFIYLDIPAQKKAITSFHYALRENGYLMLGKSETISAASQLFLNIHNGFKIYTRKKISGPSILPVLLSRLHTGVHVPQAPEVDKELNQDLTQKSLTKSVHNMDSLIDEILLKEFMPASVVINHQLEIQQFRGATDNYFTHATGKASLNILKMARPEISFDLRSTIARAIKSNKPVHKSGVELYTKTSPRVIRIDVVPLQVEWEEPLVLVVFTEQEQKELIKSGPKGKENLTLAKDRRIKLLEEELTEAHAAAMILADEQEAFIEELQSASQEVVSSNEELQTVNEELETSKEEIESTNEELTATNQELQTRNDLLIDSYDYSKAIIATLQNPLVVLNKELRIKTANSSFYKKFGISQEESEGCLIYELGNKQLDIPKLRELLENIIPKKNPFYDFEVNHTFPGIGNRTLMLNASQLVQRSHEEKLILLSISDVTDSVQLQLKERESFNKDIEGSKKHGLMLEMDVKERTSDLKEANKSLAQTIDELQEMNKELEAFAYVSSHDLQEPLRKIQMFSGLLLDKEIHNISEHGQQYFTHILQAAERMQALIRDLLSFSRVGTTERNFEVVNLNIIINDIKDEFKERIEEADAIITCNSLCDVYVIPFLFRQVMYNLFSNAFKFVRKGVPLQLVIHCEEAEKKVYTKLNLDPLKKYCHISVSDNGIGFENKFGDKIFEIFQQLHSKDEFQGTGIGLAIVKKIVNNHNGVVMAKGRPGKGSTFDIYIPSKS